MMSVEEPTFTIFANELKRPISSPHKSTSCFKDMYQKIKCQVLYFRTTEIFTTSLTFNSLRNLTLTNSPTICISLKVAIVSPYKF